MWFAWFAWFAWLAFKSYPHLDVLTNTTPNYYNVIIKIYEHDLNTYLWTEFYIYLERCCQHGVTVGD